MLAEVQYARGGTDLVLRQYALRSDGGPTARPGLVVRLHLARVPVVCEVKVALQDDAVAAAAVTAAD